MGPRLHLGSRVLLVARCDDGQGLVLDGGHHAETRVDWRYVEDYGALFGDPYIHAERFAGFHISIHTGPDAEGRWLTNFDEWFNRTRAETTEQDGLPAGLLELPRGRG